MHPPGDVSKIYEPIKLIYNDKVLAKNMGMEGRKRAIKLYDYNLVSTNLYKYINDVCSLYSKFKKISNYSIN